MKLSLFTDDMILYVENPKDSRHTRKPVRANKQIQQFQDMKLTHKSVNFLYFSKEQSEKEIKKTIYL